MTGILITQTGVHTAEQWASMSVKEIIQVAEGATGTNARQALQLQLDILDVIQAAHQAVQDHERSEFAEKGSAHLSDSPAVDTACDLDATVASIVALAVGGPFEDHFATAEVQAHIKWALGSHMATSIDIERSTWNDQHQDISDEHTADYRFKRYGTPTQ